ncbi:MAG: hypothetical protein LUH59_01100, partial [Firmicutes bacterium]|nr:hypothetical protein [Bacillota bacterium]
ALRARACSHTITTVHTPPPGGSKIFTPNQNAKNPKNAPFGAFFANQTLHSIAVFEWLTYLG